MSSRLEQINSLLVKECSALLQTEVEFGRDMLVTVTKAETSVDLRYATVFISVLPERKGPSTLAKLKRHMPHIQYLLNRKLVLRRTPQLRVALDEGERHAAAIERILAKEKRFGTDKKTDEPAA